MRVSDEHATRVIAQGTHVVSSKAPSPASRAGRRA
ncbi:hypothetical protein [Streptomyces luteocolor]